MLKNIVTAVTAADVVLSLVLGILYASSIINAAKEEL